MSHLIVQNTEDRLFRSWLTEIVPHQPHNQNARHVLDRLQGSTTDPVELDPVATLLPIVILLYRQNQKLRQAGQINHDGRDDRYMQKLAKYVAAACATDENHIKSITQKFWDEIAANQHTIPDWIDPIAARATVQRHTQPVFRTLPKDTGR